LKVMVAAEFPSLPALPPGAAKHDAKDTKALLRGKRSEAQSAYELAQASSSRSDPSGVTYKLRAIAAARHAAGQEEAISYLERALEQAPSDWQNYARGIPASDLGIGRDGLPALDQAWLYPRQTN
jgi:hypothetical protein